MLEHHTLGNNRGGDDTETEDSEEVPRAEVGEGQDGRNKARI